MNEREIFDAALAIDSSSERRQYLHKVCSGEVNLIEHIEGLVTAHQQLGSFLQSPPHDMAATIDRPLERPGTEIGPYKLLQIVGEGGMGIVYMAEQTAPVERRVALKIIKPGMDSRQVIARFEAERQALALMDHPNIARVLDASTTDAGRPYFVMELVKGVPITTYCDQQHLTPRQRLELFIPVCHAVQHAHHKGIIHRDLKPSNVLVALYDGEPVPKVIDFGIAKATTQKLTEKTMFTQYGQVVGTLEYMSPEQAQVNQLDVDTRSDIYSLGVLLYELLTGATPFERQRLQSAAFEEMMRIIREEEPPRPSIRLSTIDTLPSVAANRRVEPQKLRSLIRGELDWIVMKALEKDRARRYETAIGLAADIHNYLDDEPVVACPPSAGYRLRKLVRRNKAALLTVSVVALALLAGLAGTTWQAVVAKRAKATAEEERDLAERQSRRAARAEATARTEANRANDQLRISNVLRLTTQSASIQDELPVQSVLLGIEAVESTRRLDGTTLPAAQSNLLSTTFKLGGQPLVGHEGPVWKVAISPDGEWLATASSDRSARLWPLGAVNPTAAAVVLKGHTAQVFDVKFTPDSERLVTAGNDNTARVWDLTAEDPTRSSLVLQGHEALINHIAITPNGHRLVTSSWDNTARVWDLTSEDPTAGSIVLRGHEKHIISIAVGPQGRWLLTGSEDNTARLWDLDTGAAVHVLRGHEEAITAALISPNGLWAVTASKDNTGRLWDLTQDDPSDSARVLRGHRDDIRALAITPDSRRLLTADLHGQIRTWELSNGPLQTEARVWSADNSGIVSMTVSGGSRWLTTGSRNGITRRWDMQADDPTKSFVEMRGHESTVTSIAASQDGRWLVTGSWDGVPRRWDLDAENPASPLVLRHLQGVPALAMSADGHRLVSASWDGTARLWSLTADSPSAASKELRGHEDSVNRVAISPDGHWVITASDDFTARLWDNRADDVVASSHVLRGHEDIIVSMAVSPDSRWLVTGSWDETARLWDLRTDDPGASARVLRGHQDKVTAVAISPNGRRLATAGEDGTTRVWDLSAEGPSPVPQVLRGHHLGVFFAEFSPDSEWLVTGGPTDRNVRIWNLSNDNVSLSPAWVLPCGSGAFASIGREGGRLVTGSRDGTISIWDLTKQDPEQSRRVLRGHSARIFDHQVSRDGRWLVTASGDNTGRVWDLNSADPLASSIVLRGHESAVRSVVMSPDCRWVITGSADETVRMWDLRVDSLLDRARQFAGRELTAVEKTQYYLAERPDGR